MYWMHVSVFYQTGLTVYMEVGTIEGVYYLVRSIIEIFFFIFTFPQEENKTFTICNSLFNRA